MADLTNACNFWAQVVTTSHAGLVADYWELQVKSALSTLRERVDAFPQVLFEELQQVPSLDVHRSVPEHRCAG